MPEIAGFTTVVDDMRCSLEFYRRLGLDAPMSADSRGFVAVAIGPDTHLAFAHTPTDSGGRDGLNGLNGLNGLRIGVRCSDPDEVDTLFRSLTSAGATTVLEPSDAPWGARHCRLLDPDGNTVELFAPLP